MKNTLFGFLILLLFAQVALAAGNIDSTFNASITEGTGGVNRTLTQPDGKILVVGLFQRANGARFNNIARFNADGTLDTTFVSTGSGANAAISAIALQPDNKIIIGGNFTVFKGVTINRLARLNADGSIDPSFNSTANYNNFIYDILLQADGKILVAGSFSAASGQPLSSRIARLNSDGSLDAGFQNNLNTNNAIDSIAQTAEGKILIGGEFTSIGGETKPYIARINVDGTLDNTFTSPQPFAEVSKIIVQPDGKLLLAGGFVLGVRRLNADGTPTEPAAKSAAPSFIIYHGYDAALLPDGKVLVAFGVGSGIISSFYVHRLNADLTLDASFQATPPERVPVYDINLLAGGKAIIGGEFVSLNDEPRLHIARVNTDGTVDSTFNAAISATGSVRVIKRQPDGKILVGGIFEYANGVRKKNLVRLNPNGTVDNSFNVPLDLFNNYSPNYVFDIELQSDGKIIVARYVLSGIFLALTEPFGEFSETGIIRLNSDGTLDESFTTIAAGLMRSAAVASDNSIFIGGSFEQFLIQPFSGVFGKLMANGDFDPGFYPATQQPAGAINDITIEADGKILVGGTFLTVGGTEHPGTVRYNANGTIDTAYNAIIPNVNTLGLASDGKIYVGGNFPLSGGNPNRNLARLKTDGSIDTSFVGTANAQVRDLLVQPDNKIIIGGDFTTYYSNTVGRIARVNTNGSFDSSFNTGAGASGTIYALEKQADGKILAGGQFLDFDGTEKLSIVRLQNVNPTTPYDFDGDSKTDLSIFRPSNGEWWYSRSSNGQVAAAQFGSASDQIVPADFTGDGRADIAIWRPSTGEWFILRSDDGSFYSVPFGTSGDIPAPSDFDADGRADLAVFRPSSGTWFINKSAGGTDIINFGQAGDVPVAADYDGDGRADIAI